MASDDFAAALELVQRSRLAAVWAAVIGSCRRTVAQSLAAALWRKVWAGVGTIEPTARLRLAGVLLLTATLTQYGLLTWVPPMEKPGAPPQLRLVTVAMALVLILLAPRIARSWRSSWMARLAEGRR